MDTDRNKIVSHTIKYLDGAECGYSAEDIRLESSFWTFGFSCVSILGLPGGLQRTSLEMVLCM